MRREWKSRLGVSTVIANMMMILITLSLAAILVAWAGSSYGAFTGGTQVFFAQRGQALQERFVIEEVFFNKTQDRLLVFVRNVGVININVVAIYVNGTSPPITGGGSFCTLSSPTTLGVGAVCEYNLNWGTTWTVGSIFLIVVASARGNQASYKARGP